MRGARAASAQARWLLRVARPRWLGRVRRFCRPMILDMDGVLYKNAAVERQIVDQLELQTRNLGLQDTACQQLYERYGSTIRGLISEGHLCGDEAIEEFYRKVYSAVDVQALRPDPLLAKQLEHLRHQGVEVWLATNSPEPFVRRVLGALELPPLRLLCPSPRNAWHDKPHPRYFAELPSGCFFDDSQRNCRAYEQHVGGKAYHVTRETDVMMLVADALQVVPASWRLRKAPYLQAKEAADLQSLNEQVLQRLRHELQGVTGEVKVLDLGCGLLSMLPVLRQLLPGARLRYTGVDRDAELLEEAARREDVTLKCQDAAEAVRDAGPQTLVVGCSILDLIDVPELATALQKHQAGALLYFPIHYAGRTTFTGARATGARALSELYDASLETRGQTRNVTELFSLLGEALMLGTSDWKLAGDDPLLKQLISFMGTNALGFQEAESLRSAVAQLRDGDQLHADVELHVANVDYLGRVPVDGEDGPGRLAVEFMPPGVAQLVAEAVPACGEGEVLVETKISGISAGTERRMLLQGPGAEPLDTELPALQQGGWPLRYGYCLVGTALSGALAGRRVFCFHPHASRAVVAEESVKLIPEDVDDEDAVFFANMETACSLCQDAAPVLGDVVGVYGCGVVGALTAALLKRQGHAVRAVDVEERRLEVLRRWGVLAGRGEVDVAVEVSGAGKALAQAVQDTRRGGKVVLGSLYSEEVQLPLDLRFHRSELQLQASQVSRVSGKLASRWSKARRAELCWQMLRELKPKEWVEIRKVPITDAPNVYRSLVAGEGPMQWIFTY